MTDFPGKEDGTNSPVFLHYVTNWSLLTLAFYAWAAFISTTLPHVQWLDTTAWYLHGVAAPLAVMVTVLFWA